MYNTRGFTFIEILIVLAVLALSAGGLFLAFSSSLKNQALITSTQTFTDALSEARTYSRTYKDEAQWGVRSVSSTEYEIYKHTATSTESSKSYKLASGLSFISPFTVEYLKTTGAVSAATSITITNGRIQKLINISVSGVHDIQTL